MGKNRNFYHNSEDVVNEVETPAVDEPIAETTPVTEEEVKPESAPVSAVKEEEEPKVEVKNVEEKPAPAPAPVKKSGIREIKVKGTATL